MTTLNCVLCCLFTSFAVHYAWKLRGTVVGGEKGAMIPGLFAGTILALFAGGSIAKFFWIPAAAGLIGMSYGGIEPYGDSIAFLEGNWFEKREWDVEPNAKKGYFGLALKGALWFSICGGYIAMSMSAMGGKYKISEIIIFIITVFVFQLLGYNIFNQPYNEDKKVYPKIYLSFESRDEWGSNIGVLCAVILFAIIKKDVLAISMTAGGFVFGAVGWLVAMQLYHYTECRMKNGKFLLGFLSEKNLVGGWGNMEYTLGSFGGLGIALGFVLAKNYVAEINNAISANGLFNPLKGYDTYVILVMVFLFIALFIINLIAYNWDVQGKKYSGFIFDCIERPFFNNLPFVLVLLCALPAAKLLTVFMAVYVLNLKNWFNRFKPEGGRTLFMIITLIFNITIFAIDIMIGGFSPVWIFVSGSVPYIVAQIWYYAAKSTREQRRNLFFRWNPFSLNILLLSVASVIIDILGYILSKGV